MLDTSKGREEPSAAQDNPVIAWFGTQFQQLHPLLQELHRHGGLLRGSVAISFGRGLAGIVGRRLARKLGIPTDVDSCDFEVRIAHIDGALHWQRRFQNTTTMLSVFHPVGNWPDGYWLERTGDVDLRLGVDVIDGGWHWRLLGARFAGCPLPLWLLPWSQACKRIVDDKYCFFVELSLPVLGPVLRYQGKLAAIAADGIFANGFE